MSERLTIPDYRVTHDDGSVTTRRSFIDGEKVREHAWELYKRLKQYEDACFDDPNEEKSIEAISLARLRELAEAEREGRVVVLPCKVGSDVWLVLPDYTECSEYGVKYSESSCAGCEIACDSKPIKTISRAKGVGLISIGGWIKSGCFGKTVFITREQADRALAEKGEDDGK